MPPKRNKIECLECRRTFDSDHRKRHNERHHKNLLKERKSIRFKIAGAPANPFEVSKQSSRSTTSSDFTLKDGKDTNFEEKSQPDPGTETPTSSCSAEKITEEKSDNDSRQQTVAKEKQGKEESPVSDRNSREEMYSKVNMKEKFPTDPALFEYCDLKRDEQLRNELCRLGPCQPRKHELKSTDGPGRSFQEHWYYNTKRNEEKTAENKRDWLIYSPRRKRMFCFWCILFIPETTPLYENNWTEVGVCNWKKALEKIREHENTDIHLLAAFKYSLFVSGENIKECLSRNAKITSLNRKRKIEDNRKSLTVLLQLSRTLACQNIAFRGHDESQSSSNRGNFKELASLIAKFDLVLAKQLKENPRYANYLSPAAQNEMIYSLAEVLRREIIEEIKAAGVYSILIDETADISKKEQVSLIFRYAIYGDIYETFLLFKDVASTTGESLFEMLKVALESYGFDIHNIRGIGTDGAANMQGRYKGLKARVSEINPYAKSVHCACHALNLVLVQALQSNVKIKVFFANLEELYKFIEASPKRHECFQQVQKAVGSEKARTLKRHSYTRWESHSQVVKEVKANYPAVIAMLERVLEEESERDTVSKASGFLTFCRKFESVLMTIVFDDILHTTNILNKTLQGNDIDLSEAYLLIDACLENLRAMRNETKLEAFLEMAKELARKADAEAEFQDRRPQRRKRNFDEMSSDEVPTDPKQLFKTDVFFYSLDMIEQQMVDRFSSHRSLLKAFQCLTPESLLKRQPEENLQCLKNLLQEFGENGSGDIQGDVLREYSLFQTRYKESNGIEISMKKRIAQKKKGRRVFKIKETISQCESAKHIFKFLHQSKLCKVFPNLYKLYQVFLTIPVTSAEAERAFSKLKIIKSYQRSTMNQQRTSDLAIVSIERQRPIDYGLALGVFASLKHRRKEFSI